MSTLDNLMTGRLLKQKQNFLMQALYFGPVAKEAEEHRERVERVIDFLDLQSIRRTPVGSLPYGLQKRVELGRALAMEPEILLLDEPSSALDLLNQERLFSILESLKYENNICIVFSTHEPNQVLKISDSVILLSHDHHIYGSTNEVMNVTNLNKVYNVNFEKLNSIKKTDHVFFNHLPN